MHKSGLNAEVQFARLLALVMVTARCVGHSLPLGMNAQYHWHQCLSLFILCKFHPDLMWNTCQAISLCLQFGQLWFGCAILYSCSNAHCRFAFGNVNAHMLFTYSATLLAVTLLSGPSSDKAFCVCSMHSIVMLLFQAI